MERKSELPSESTQALDRGRFGPYALLLDRILCALDRAVPTEKVDSTSEHEIQCVKRREELATVRGLPSSESPPEHNMIIGSQYAALDAVCAPTS